MLSKRLAILSIIRHNLNAGQMALLDPGDVGVQEGEIGGAPKPLLLILKCLCDCADAEYDVPVPKSYEE